MVKEGTVLPEQWKELGHAILKHVQLQVTQICSKGDNQIAFFCLDQPVHSSLANQMGNTNPNLSLHNPTVMEHQLAVDIKNLGRQIRVLCLYNRVMGMQKTGVVTETVATKNIHHIEKKIGDQIKYALVLDLTRRPRLSRTNAGKLRCETLLLFPLLTLLF